MTLVRFISADGACVQEAEAAPGERLLDVGQRLGLPLEGTCEGQMACSTCHVIVAAEDFAKLPPASEEEEDMLDLASHVTRHSRLSCQLYASEALGRLTLRLPGGVHNMQGR
jgi:ferredoxin